ncbi:hypothetical protein HBH98_161930 [Parastagonospora nodorum]|nr:hypothetical protein HBH53_258830 [Parastagonospora nodorum]KAH3956082.1 hypothetical protein HBH51_255990 [Parastagonospora nodorum]KAH4223045.1 hypothetical protein HBI05_251990 [Parastagonospora nodorum]KAH4342741.1 hypothetical protein HBH98_161930 [Parastagonospora nodorum]KAH4354375.1 hypothetical protein HBH97_249530 [Parastagonospora nodorum]
MASPDAEDTFPPPQYRRGMDDDMAAEQKTNDSSPSQETSNGQKAASNAKDPLGPRRKRARRVCSACQRAHLTCGDERPCTRCIKRGLQDDCGDGVSKGHKSLHVAPYGALMPGAGGHNHYGAFGIGKVNKPNYNGMTINETENMYSPQSTGAHPATISDLGSPSAPNGRPAVEWQEHHLEDGDMCKIAHRENISLLRTLKRKASETPLPEERLDKTQSTPEEVKLAIERRSSQIEGHLVQDDGGERSCGQEFEGTLLKGLDSEPRSEKQDQLRQLGLDNPSASVDPQLGSDLHSVGLSVFRQTRKPASLSFSGAENAPSTGLMIPQLCDDFDTPLWLNLCTPRESNIYQGYRMGNYASNLGDLDCLEWSDAFAGMPPGPTSAPPCSNLGTSSMENQTLGSYGHQRLSQGLGFDSHSSEQCIDVQAATSTDTASVTANVKGQHHDHLPGLDNHSVEMAPLHDNPQTESSLDRSNSHPPQGCHVDTCQRGKRLEHSMGDGLQVTYNETTNPVPSEATEASQQDGGLRWHVSTLKAQARAPVVVKGNEFVWC